MNNIIYFNKIESLKKNFIYERKNRKKIKGFQNFLIFKVGDIVQVAFSKGAFFATFEGICISIKKKSFLSLNVSFILRNVILGIAIEMCFSYFLNRVYRLKLLDFKRKHLFFRKNKLLLIRNKVNKFSLV